MPEGASTASVESTQGPANSAGHYTVYAAGGLFTQHELTTNVLIKEAVWRLSKGRFELVLPQSEELRQLDRPDIAAYIRNVDLLQVVQTDALLARFDGLELDTGTVVEFMMARMLGKPTLILRSDTRHLSGQELDEPYNLMVKSWPRSVEVHVDSLMNYIGLIAEQSNGPGDSQALRTLLEAELSTIQAGVDQIARKVIDGLQAVVEMNSPYPPEYQEMVYKAARYSPGSGFDKLLTESKLEAIIRRLRHNGTL